MGTSHYQLQAEKQLQISREFTPKLTLLLKNWKISEIQNDLSPKFINSAEYASFQYFAKNAHQALGGLVKLDKPQFVASHGTQSSESKKEIFEYRYVAHFEKSSAELTVIMEDLNGEIKLLRLEGRPIQ